MNAIITGAVTVTAILGILWTLLPLLKNDVWWVRVFDFPRTQIAFLSLGTAIAYAAVIGWKDTGDKVLIIILSLCILSQLFQIIKYSPFYPSQLKSALVSDPDKTVHVLIANVLTPNRNSDALLRLIRQHNPDIVLAVETDDWWQSRLDALDSDFPFSIKHPLDNLYGMHLYSRLELLNRKTLFLVEDDVPSMHADVVLRSGHQVGLHCHHPAPPGPTENPTSAERDAELLAVAKLIDGQERPVIVMGDMNDVAWSATTRLFQKISGLLDPRIGRGMYSTFHAKYPFLRWPLDHVFCSSDFTLVSLARLDDIGSDHFPIRAELQYSPSAARMHNEPQADAIDHQDAQQKIDKAPTNEAALK